MASVGDTSVKITSDNKKDIIDWSALRQLSLEPSGFGEDRIQLWPKLLNVSTTSASSNDEKSVQEGDTPREIEETHQDERQISLDTDRSFVLYPVDPNYDKETLQAGLNKLLVSLFRQRPKLSYFQGYHDIATVIFLTLPRELHLACIEKISLHRLRDSMGTGLEPVLGLLRVTKNLLRLADSEYASLLEENSPLPFYALSNLLTLFSHDMPTLPLIQHVFDYLLCRPPIAVVYLATVFILVRKQEAIRLAEEDEEGMIHSLLSSLPHLADDPSTLDASKPVKPHVTQLPDGAPSLLKEELQDDKSILSELDAHPLPVEAVQQPDAFSENPKGPDNSSNSPTTDLSEPLNPVKPESIPPVSLTADDTGIIDEEINHPKTLSVPSPAASVSEPKEEAQPQEPRLKHPSKPTSTHLFLTDLLKRADELYSTFPPDHSALHLSSIMGPQSVIFTWSERFSSLPSDSTAEAMVLRPELVVYPYVPEPDHDQEISKKATEKGKEDRKRRNKLKKSPFGQMEKKTMLAGTVLVLGVAMAVYGIKARNASGHPLFAEGHVHPTTKDWKRLSGWVGSTLIGAGSKLLGGDVSLDK